MAQRIPNSDFVGLTGGHLLLGHQAAQIRDDRRLRGREHE